MKFHVTAFKAPKGVKDYPMEVARSRDLLLMSLAPLLQMHGIKGIQLNTNMMGPKAIESPKLFLDEEADVPEELVALRNSVARHVSNLLSLFGIEELKLDPDEEERKNMVRRWRFLRGGEV